MADILKQEHGCQHGAEGRNKEGQAERAQGRGCAQLNDAPTPGMSPSSSLEPVTMFLNW